MKMEAAKFTWRGFADEQYAEFPKHYAGNKAVRMSAVTDFSYDVAQRIIACRAIVDFHQEDELYLRCGIVGGFEIDTASWNSRIDKEANAVMLERDLHAHFAVFTIGGLRGYLHARQQRGQLPAFLSPVNVLEMLPPEVVWAIPLSNSTTG